MDEMNWILPPELDSAMQQYYKRPEPSPDFVSRLDRELRSHQSPISIPSWKNKDRFMQSLRTRPALAILLAILALLFLSGVVYAIGRLSGYIPGFGFTSGDPYILNAPIDVTQNNVGVRIEHAVHDTSGLWVELSVRGLSDGDNYAEAYILSKIGEKIQSQRGGAINPETDVWRLTYVFPALEDPSEPITLLLENLGGQTFQITLTLRPAKIDEVLPASLGDTLPIQGAMRDHMALMLNSVAMSTDRTVLQVSLHFDQPGIWLNAPWGITMKDDQGRIYPLTDITPQTSDIGLTRLYQTVPLQGNEKLTLNLVSFPPDRDLPMLMDFSTNPAVFTFDPGTDPQVGQTWTLDETLQVGSFTLHIVGARMTSPTGLVFDFEPIQNVRGAMLYSTLASGASGGVPVQGRSRQGLYGNFTAGMTFARVPNIPFEIQLRSVYYTARGPWRLEWQAPAAAVLNFPTMTPAPSPTPLTIPTLTSQDPILLEVQALAQKFDHAITQGPVWIHIVYENTKENIPPGQTYPPPYYKHEQWYEIDEAGWVTRSLTTDYDANVNILQQSASIGTKTINFTTGDVFEYPLYQLSLDILTRDLDSALSREQPVLREETSCDDGSSCLLITVLDQIPQSLDSTAGSQVFSGRGQRVWINLETGQQVKYQVFLQLQDGTEMIDFTRRVLLTESVTTPLDGVLQTLDKVITP